MSGEVASLKRSIESWREIVILGDSVLSWEKEWYPAVTSGTLSFLFLLVWSQDPSVLTLFGMIGLVMTLLDYAVPLVQAKLFAENSWTADKEQRLDQICQELVFVKTGIRRLANSLLRFRETSPLMFLLGFVVFFYIVAYFGSIFSGIFLFFVLFLNACMLPGLHRRGLLKKYCASLVLKIGDYVKAKKLE